MCCRLAQFEWTGIAKKQRPALVIADAGLLLCPQVLMAKKQPVLVQRKCPQKEYWPLYSVTRSFAAILAVEDKQHGGYMSHREKTARLSFAAMDSKKAHRKRSAARLFG